MKYLWSDPFLKDRKPPTKLGSLVVMIGVFAYFAFVGQPSPQEQQKQQTKLYENITDPIEYIKARFIKEPEANVRSEHAAFGNSFLILSYSIDPWTGWSSLARNRFIENATAIIPAVFAKFPELSMITISSTATLVDIKGNESTKEVMSIRFSRDNSATINWENINRDNVMKVADQSWVHPVLLK